MGLRKHVLDLLTGPDVPVRHIVGFHLLFPLRFQSLTFTDALHDGEGKLTLQSLIDQVDHDIITGTDGRGNGRFSFLYQCLCITQPHIRTMGQTGDTDQIRKRLAVWYPEASG